MTIANAKTTEYDDVCIDDFARGAPARAEWQDITIKRTRRSIHKTAYVLQCANGWEVSVIPCDRERRPDRWEIAVFDKTGAMRYDCSVMDGDVVACLSRTEVVLLAALVAKY